MYSQRLIWYLGLTLFGFACLFFSSSSSTLADHCRDDTKPVDRLEIKFYVTEGEQCETSWKTKQQIPVGCNFRLDSTGFYGSGHCQTDGSKNIQWTYTPSSLVQTSTRGNNPFTPWLTAKGSGVLSVQATLDGVSSNTITVALGDAKPTAPGPKVEPVGEQYCAYKEKDGTLFCIKDSLNDESCKETPECKDKTCTRVGSEQCAAGGPAFDKPLPVPVRQPQELGPLIGNFYLWSIGIVGLLVFLVFFQAGFTWLVTAAGDPGKIRASQDRMWNAVLGAILLFSAYVILRTINPDLVGQKGVLMPGLPPPRGASTNTGAPANPLPVANPK